MLRRAPFALLTSVLALVAASSWAAGNFPQPTICNRACWSARAPQGTITYNASLTRAVIHHTAISSDYNTTSLDTSKVKVRAIQNYHMDSNGWVDIGYNFLADKLGNNFEGRYASMTAYTYGSHDGWNTNSMGFNAMGYFHSPYNDNPTTAQRQALYDLIAWRMPNGWSPYGGSAYGYSSNAGFVCGHRDPSQTACPGDLLYAYITTNLNGGECRNEINTRINGGGGGTEVVVDNDNGAPGYSTTGTWTTSATSGYNGGSYQYANSVQSHTATWTANLPSSGDWKVEVIYRAGTNRTSSTKYTINHSGGASTVYINQQTNNLLWVNAGTYTFAASNNTVVLDALGSTPTAKVVIADAVKFTQISAGPTPTPSPTPSPSPSPTPSPSPSPSPSPTPSPSPSPTPSTVDIVINNDGGAPGFSAVGTWSTVTSGGYNNSSYRWTSTNFDGRYCTFNFNVPAAGNYNTYVWYVAGSNRASAAKYVVTTSSGDTTVYINQTLTGSQWVSLGNFNFAAGGGVVKVYSLGSTPSAKVVVADAARVTNF